MQRSAQYAVRPTSLHFVALVALKNGLGKDTKGHLFELAHIKNRKQRPLLPFPGTKSRWNRQFFRLLMISRFFSIFFCVSDYDANVISAHKILVVGAKEVV